MPRQFFYPYPDDKYRGGVVLQEYNGILELVAAGRGNGNGTVYTKWCYPKTKEGWPSDKALPWKITLGNDREAVKLLEYFLSQISTNWHKG